MGTDYTMKAIVGLEIPVSWLFQAHKTFEPRCPHTNADEAKFCSVCGKPTNPIVRTHTTFTPEAIRLAGVCDDDLYDCIWRDNLRVGTVQLYYNTDNCGGENLIAGELVAQFDDPKYEGSGHRVEPFPPLPTETSLREFLEANGIPTKGDFGVHLVVVGN